MTGKLTAVATIYEVAQRAGVSPSTVSRVVSGRRAVNPDLAKRVLKAADELSFRPNRAARNLRLQRSATIALVVPDIENPFCTSLARGAEDVAQQGGYNVVLCNTDDDPAKEAQYFDVIEADRMAGAIIAGASGRDGVAKLAAAGTPLVAVDHMADGVDNVFVDYTDAAREATLRLLSAGCRRIACVAGTGGPLSVRQRVRGFHQAVASTPDAQAVLVERPGVTVADGYDAVTELLMTTPRPDALFAVQDTLALGALHALRAAGVRPGDFGIASFGLDPWTDAIGWPLVTVEQPTRDLGRMAATMLLERVAGDTSPPRTVALPTQVREIH